MKTRDLNCLKKLKQKNITNEKLKENKQLLEEYLIVSIDKL
jgi:hypothetical protein